MSRYEQPIGENITIHLGIDHAIGEFLDIADERFAGNDEDESGEGFVLEWCQMFGITTNFIGATVDDISNLDVLIAKTNSFAASLASTDL